MVYRVATVGVGACGCRPIHYGVVRRVVTPWCRRVLLFACALHSFAIRSSFLGWMVYRVATVGVGACGCRPIHYGVVRRVVTPWCRRVLLFACALHSFAIRSSFLSWMVYRAATVGVGACGCRPISSWGCMPRCHPLVSTRAFVCALIVFGLFG